MVNRIYVNLAVKDLKRSMEFFSKLGFSYNKQFTNDKAACLVLGENFYAMLLQEDFFKTFTKKEMSDANKTTEVLIALDVNSRNEVDEMVSKAVKAGGSIYRDPDDHGWMYGHSFADLDGHQWEVGFMDLKSIPEEMKNADSI